MRIEGHTVFVTGGGGGIGLALGEACARRGGNVVLADIVKERLDATVAAFAGPVLGVVMDVTSHDDWKRARREAEAGFGQVDILVNSAGTPPCLKPILDTPPEEVQARFTTHLLGTFLGLHTFGPPMRDRGSGHLVNISSEAGLVPIPMLGDYAAAKYGITGLTEILNVELEGSGVRATVVFPGLTESNMTIGMGMNAKYVGEAIARGIEADSLYVITHPSVRPAIKRRFETILAAIGEFADPGYVHTDTQWQ